MFVIFIKIIIICFVYAMGLNGSTIDIDTMSEWHEGVFDNCTVVSQSNNLVVRLSSPDWWDANYLYRRKLAVKNNLPYKITNFQFVITNQLPTLIAQLKLEGKLRSDCRDLRFVDEKGNRLDYWLYPSGTNIQQIWIKLKELEGNSTGYIYMYYNNPSAEKVSSFDSTMSKTGVTEGIEAIWHFDEGSGTTIYDRGTNNIGLEFINSPVWCGTDGGTWGNTDVKFTNGDSISFDGSSSYLKSIDDLSQLDNLKESTIMLWCKFDVWPAVGSGMTLVTKRTTGGPWSYRKINIWNSSGNIWCQYYEATNKNVAAGKLVEYQTNFKVNKWYQIAAVFDSSNGKVQLYINGKLKSENSIPTSAKIVHTVSKVFIGANESTPKQVFNGAIDEVVFYNRALSEEEILANYERRKFITTYPSLLFIGEETGYSTSSLFTNGDYSTKIIDTGYENGVWLQSIMVKGIITNYTFLSLNIAGGSTGNLYFSSKEQITISKIGEFYNCYSNFSDSLHGSRYLQLKIGFNGDGVNTPLLQEIKINYTQIPDNIELFLPHFTMTNIDLYHIKLMVPALDNDTKLIIKKKEETSFIPVREPWDSSSVYEIKMLNYPALTLIDRVNKKLGLIFRLKSSDYKNMDNFNIDLMTAEERLNIAYWNGSSWSILDTIFSREDNIIYLKTYIEMSGIYGIVDINDLKAIDDRVDIIQRVFNPYSDNMNFQRVKFIVHGGMSATIELSIFDFSGDLVFKVKKYKISQIEWDGRYMSSGKRVKEGGYLYEIKKDGRVIKRGTIFVMK